MVNWIQFSNPQQNYNIKQHFKFHRTRTPNQTQFSHPNKTSASMHITKYKLQPNIYTNSSCAPYYHQRLCPVWLPRNIGQVNIKQHKIETNTDIWLSWVHFSRFLYGKEDNISKKLKKKIRVKKLFSLAQVSFHEKQTLKFVSTSHIREAFSELNGLGPKFKA